MTCYFRTLIEGQVFVAHGGVYQRLQGDRVRRVVSNAQGPWIAFGFDPWEPVEPLHVVVIHEFPPIPVRHWDWIVHLEDYDGAPDAGWQPIGNGATSEAALVDFAAEIEAHTCEGSA